MSSKDFINLIKENKLYDALELLKQSLSEEYTKMEKYEFDKIGCFAVCNEVEGEEKEYEESDEEDKEKDDEMEEESCKKENK